MPSSRSRRRLSRLETYASRFSKGKYMQVPVNDQLTSRVICRTTSGPPRASPAGLTTNGTLRGRALQYAAGAFCRGIPHHPSTVTRTPRASTFYCTRPTESTSKVHKPLHCTCRCYIPISSLHQGLKSSLPLIGKDFKSGNS